MIRAVIFDCFGVLLVDAFAAMVIPLRDSNRTLFDEIMALTEASVRGQITPDEFRQNAAEMLGMDVDEFVQKEQQGEVKNQDVLDFAASLRPKLRTAMLSNIGSAGLEHRFVSGELEKYFDVVVASGDIGFAKPEPQAYEITAERLSVRADECVMIDDRENYCAGAKAVGMQAICFTSLPQLKRELDPLLSQS
ncbi:MAG TPA: HAD family phosphatase [Candidatus Saccharimonadales bacterium]